jgi:hypothetical protein
MAETRIYYYKKWEVITAIIFVAIISVVFYYNIDLFFNITKGMLRIVSIIIFATLLFFWMFFTRKAVLVDIENDVLKPFGSTAASLADAKDLDNPYKRVLFLIRNTNSKLRNKDINDAQLNYDKIIAVFPRLEEKQRQRLIKSVYALRKKIEDIKGNI